MEFLGEAEFWVAVGLFLFIGVVLWQGVPAVLGRMLDARSAAIARELEEARALRQEAEALLASYRAKTKDVDTETAAILATARAEAEHLQTEARTAAEALIKRRTKMAEDKIAQAEATALAEVKATAAQAAIGAAAQILGERVTGAKATQLADDAIRDLRSRLN